MHTARLLKDRAKAFCYGNQRPEWDAGCLWATTRTPSTDEPRGGGPACSAGFAHSRALSSEVNPLG